MMRLPIAITVAAVVCAAEVAINGYQNDPKRGQGLQAQAPEPPMAGIHWARGRAPARRAVPPAAFPGPAGKRWRRR